MPKTKKDDNPLHIPGFQMPVIEVPHQGAYLIGPAWLRSGSRLRGFFVVDLDSREKRIEIKSFSQTGWNDRYIADDETPGTVSLHVGPRDEGDHTIFYTDDDLGSDPVDIHNWSEMHVHLPRPATSFIPLRIRKALRIPSYEWQFSVNQFYDKYGFTFHAWLEKSYTP